MSQLCDGTVNCPLDYADEGAHCSKPFMFFFSSTYFVDIEGSREEETEIMIVSAERKKKGERKRVG